MSVLDRLASEVRGRGGLLASEVSPASADGLREAAGDVPVQIASATGLLTVFFSDELPVDYEDVGRCDFDRYAAWCRQLLARGVYPPPSQFEAWFPSLAHSPEHVERTLEAAAAAFGEIA